jgi:hypothetical protein
MTSRQCIRDRDKTLATSAMSVLLAMAASVGGCAAGPQARAVASQATDSSLAQDRGASRGFRPGRLEFDYRLQVFPSGREIPDPLREGATLMSGDRIDVLVQPSDDSYLYLAFCTRHGFLVRPSPSGILARAGTLTHGPRLIADDDPGREVLYVILSREQISSTAPKLWAALERSSPGHARPACAVPAPPASSVSFGEPPRPYPPSPKSEPSGTRPPQPTTPRPDPGSVGPKPMPPSGSFPQSTNAPPDSTPIRGPDGPQVVVDEDDDDIAVVRHTFVHSSPIAATRTTPVATATAPTSP